MGSHREATLSISLLVLVVLDFFPVYVSNYDNNSRRLSLGRMRRTRRTPRRKPNKNGMPIRLDQIRPFYRVSNAYIDGLTKSTVTTLQRINERYKDMI